MHKLQQQNQSKMKNIISISLQKTLILLSIVMALTSCKKDAQQAKKLASSGKFTFKLDGGAALNIDSATATLYTSSGVRLMDVYAYKSGAEILEFHFEPKTGVKTAGTVLGTGAFLTYMESAVKSYDSQSGTLNLTTCDTTANKIEGDFSFVAKQYPYTSADTRTITEGHLVVTRITK